MTVTGKTLAIASVGAGLAGVHYLDNQLAGRWWPHDTLRVEAWPQFDTLRSSRRATVAFAGLGNDVGFEISAIADVFQQHSMLFGFRNPKYWYDPDKLAEQAINRQVEMAIRDVLLSAFSLGTLPTIQFLRQYAAWKDRTFNLHGVILVSPVTCRADTDGPWGLLPYLRGGPLMRLWWPVVMWAIDQIYPRPKPEPGADQRLLRAHYQAIHRWPAPGYVAQYEALDRAKPPEPDEFSWVPATIIYHENDPLVGPSAITHLRNAFTHPDSEFIVREGNDHGAFAEMPTSWHQQLQPVVRRAWNLIVQQDHVLALP